MNAARFMVWVFVGLQQATSKYQDVGRDKPL
jgi:hypothetical protein